MTLKKKKEKKFADGELFENSFNNYNLFKKKRARFASLARNCELNKNSKFLKIFFFPFSRTRNAFIDKSAYEYKFTKFIYFSFLTVMVFLPYSRSSL